jgi:hypothetical protein
VGWLMTMVSVARASYLPSRAATTIDPAIILRA